MKARTSRVRTRNPKPSSHRPTRKGHIRTPCAALRGSRKITERLSINRSDLIRSALHEYLENWRKQELESELAEGYIANVSQARETAEDFIDVDSELL